MSDIPEDGFTKGVKSTECVSILVNYVKNVEKKYDKYLMALKKHKIIKIKQKASSGFPQGCRLNAAKV